MAANDLQIKLKEGMTFLANQEFEQAKNYFNDLLDEYPESAQCYYGLTMAELKVNNFAQLEKVDVYIGNLTSFKRALGFSDAAFRARLEAIQKKNEEYIRSKLESQKLCESESKVEEKAVEETEAVQDLKAIQNEEVIQKPEASEDTESKLEAVKEPEPIQMPVSAEEQDAFSTPVDSQTSASPLVAENNQKLDDNAAKSSSGSKKTGLAAIIIGIAAVAGYFIFGGKPSTENVEQVAAPEVAVVKNSTALDLTKPTKFKVGNVEFEMMPCQAGSFVMGSPEGELGRDESEVQHKVTISKPFLIGRFEVTQALLEEVTGINNSRYYGLENPADSISYIDAATFCKKLNEKTVLFRPAGYIFDIPTEAQWEYACRAGSTSAINNGKNLASDKTFCGNLDEVGWYTFNAFGVTHPVGQKNPNGWGIYDMHGNVAEWCKDWYQENYDLQNATDPMDKRAADSRVIRGGNFVAVPSKCRSASRNMAPEDSESISLGLRIVLVEEK